MTERGRIADALDTIAGALAEAAMALRIGPETPQEPSGAFADGTPVEEPPDWDTPESLPFDDTPQARSAQGGCPVHGLPWTVQPGGFSAAKQKTYKAFWKCPGQLPNGDFCPERPTLAWVKAHPAR